MFERLQKTGKQLIIDLLNEENDLDVRYNEVDFGTPYAVSADAFGRNTRVLIKARPNTRYFREVEVYYRRLDIAKVITGDYRRIDSDAGKPFKNTHDLVDRLTHVYGLKIDKNTVNNYKYNNPLVYKLRFAPNALDFYGEVELELTDYLSDALANNQMGGFVDQRVDTVETVGIMDTIGTSDSIELFTYPSGTAFQSKTDEVECWVSPYRSGGTPTIDRTQRHHRVKLNGQSDFGLVMGAGLLATHRGTKLPELYDIDLFIRKGDVLSGWTLDLDKTGQHLEVKKMGTQGGYISQENAHGLDVGVFILSMKELAKSLQNGEPDNQILYGDFEVTVRLIPRGAIWLEKIVIDFTMTVEA